MTSSQDTYVPPDRSPNSEVPISSSNNNLDKIYFFSALSSIGLGAFHTYLLCVLPTAVIIPLVPSIFFGLGISLGVYRFMGGLKSEDSFTIGNTLKIGGSLASLLACVFVFNYYMEKQAPSNSVQIAPDKSNLIVLNNVGEPIKLDVKTIRSEFDKAKLVDGIDKPGEDQIGQFQEKCWNGDGICKTKAIPTTIKIDSELAKGEAKVCQKFSNLAELPLMVWVPKANSIPQVVATSKFCPDASNNKLTLFISREDAKPWLKNMSNGVISGQVNIAPLKYVYKVSQLQP